MVNGKIGSIPHKDIIRVLSAHDDLVAALKVWQEFAKNNGWTDKDLHNADGTGWVTMTDEALKAAGE